MDLSDGDYGVSLLNNCKYGHDVKDNVIRLTLLRSSDDPDPIPDQGIHEMTYSLYPHSRTWKEAGTVRKGYELNNPLLAVAVKPHAGKLPKSRSFVKVFPDNLTVTALKLAEDGDGALLRFYEWTGKPCTAKVITTLPFKSYVETNLIERQTGKKSAIKDGVVELPVGKYEIKTVKLLK
jgi:alpha-mannosidase